MTQLSSNHEAQQRVKLAANDCDSQLLYANHETVLQLRLALDNQKWKVIARTEHGSVPHSSLAL
jgi:hypothetical protein